ncbi:MAG TPA: succinate dehydrogenase cytochrome b subunit [Bacteroidia bacterium]|jgi:succinate dehydrogenase / fumarate reductase cytochrome b subunit|nr:succinate dehydrogenase cytochrome b subunit [Bacteroidia bacterium]
MTLNQFIKSSLGQKTIMAASGLFLCVFLVEHLYTNLLLFANDGGIAFNEASHSMVHSIFIRIVEVLLFVAIAVHVAQAISITRQNANARPVKYAVYKVNETSSWFSRNMGLTGSLIFFFIVVHLWHFFVPYRITNEVGGDGQNNLAQAVKYAFQNGWYVLIYVIGILFLSFHLNHGFQSAFRSLGLNNKKYAPVLSIAGSVFAFVIVGIGFASMPILFYFGIAGTTF